MTRRPVPSGPPIAASGRGLDEARRVVGAPVVHDEDVDAVGEARRTRAAVARHVAAPPEVAEQLVERGADPFGLVVRRQDDGQAGVG